MTLTFPRELVFEMYLGRWVNVTALPEGRRLRQVEPVIVSWGSNAEQGRVPPSTAEGALNNDGGHWTQGNPTSDYYDYLRGRNVPTRLGLVASRDAFGRTLPSSWGTSDTGDGWNPASAGSGAQSVGSGSGVHVVSSTSSFQVSFLGDSYPDCEVAATCTVNVNDVTGGSIEPLNLVLRYQSSGSLIGEHYLLRAVVSSSEALTVAIFHSSLGAISSTISVPGLVDASSAKRLRAKFYVEGQTLRGKVYAPGPSDDPDQFEPLGWQVSAHHERLTGGFPGVRSGVASGNSNIPVSFLYDDWVLGLAQHTGELVKLQPRWDLSHRVKSASFKLADVTQRLGRPERAKLSSAPRRYFSTAHSELTTTDFWPLDEPATAAAQGLSALGKAPARFLRETGVVPNRGAVTWGATDQTHTAVPGFVGLNNGGRLVFTVDSTPLGSRSTLMFACRLSPDSGAQVFLSTTAFANRFALTLYTDGTLELFSNPSGSTVSQAAFTPGGLVDRWVTIGMMTYASGGTMVCELFVDGVGVGGGGIGADGGYVPLSEVLVHVPQPVTGGQGDSFFSNLFVCAQDLNDHDGTQFLSAKASNITLGWPGERALARAFRLCAEEGVSLDYYGDFGHTRAMGPQRPEALMDQLIECAEADQALLYAPRYSSGVVFRGRRAATGQAAQATLSYSGRQVAPEFAPSPDDRFTANLVRAERLNGGSVVVEQAVGPMNTGDPGTDPDAVGVVPAGATPKPANVDADAQLPDLAGWTRAQGTNPEVRFPRVVVDLRAPALNDVSGLAVSRAVIGLRPGDRMVVQGLQDADYYRDPDQLVRGGRTIFDGSRQHRVELNTAPYESYRGATFGGADARWDAQDSRLMVAAGATGPLLVSYLGSRWTALAASLPFDVDVGGERASVTATSRSVPSFVAAGTAAHADNAAVSPGIPAGSALNDVMILWGVIRDFGATLATPADWSVLLSLANMTFWYRVHPGGSPSAPSVAPASGNGAGDTVSAQIISLRGAAAAGGVVGPMWTFTQQFNGSQQNMPFPALQYRGGDMLAVHWGWKQDDWTGANPLPGATEMGDLPTAVGDDQGLSWQYRLISGYADVPAGEIVVVGGGAAAGRAGTILFGSPQTLTVTRSVNGAVKAHASDTPVSLWTPSYYS